ncbi:MAG TPA: helix-turn-helix transcriptional regulator [Aliidongia sp.]|nr:helix-turn-helix transcriptional regulator [Aliidongia sp.]
MKRGKPPAQGDVAASPPSSGRRSKASDTTRMINQAIGRRVRAVRTACGHSQEQLAQTLGLSFQQIQKFESGSSRISPDKLLRIAHHYDMPIASFFEGVPPELLPRADSANAVSASTSDAHYRLRLEVGRELQLADESLLRPLLELLRSSHRK